MLRNQKDKLCVVRCLAIGKCKADSNYPCHFHKTSTCTKEAHELHQLCKIAKKECGLGEIQKFANHAYAGFVTAGGLSETNFDNSILNTVKT